MAGIGKTYSKRVKALENNTHHTYAVIWGQCSSALQAKLKQVENFEEKATACDCAWILEQIKAIIFV